VVLQHVWRELVLLYVLLYVLLLHVRLLYVLLPQAVLLYLLLLHALLLYALLLQALLLYVLLLHMLQRTRRELLGECSCSMCGVSWCCCMRKLHRSTAPSHSLKPPAQKYTLQNMQTDLFATESTGVGMRYSSCMQCAAGATHVVHTGKRGQAELNRRCC
jgi:hypothetical protein